MCDSVLDGVCLCMICCDADAAGAAADDDCSRDDVIGCCVGLSF